MRNRDPFTELPKGRFAGFLGSKDEARIGSYDIPADLWQAIKERRKFFYILGRADYWDILDDRIAHVTMFCWEIRVEDGIAGQTKIGGTMCPSLNCTDEECEYQRRERNAAQAAAIGSGFPFRGVSHNN